MSAPTVRIDRLRLTVPGLARQQARQLGQEIAQRLSRRVPTELAPLELGALRLRIDAPQDMATADLADRVVEAIVERIR